MSIPLSTLIQTVGISVQKANKAIERCAADLYLEQGYVLSEHDAHNGGAKTQCSPITYTLSFPQNDSSRKSIEVPVTALLHNTSLQLEQVEVNLKFAIEECAEGLDIAVKPDNGLKQNQAYSELTLRFGNTAPSEGLARITQRQLQVL